MDLPKIKKAGFILFTICFFYFSSVLAAGAWLWDSNKIMEISQKGLNSEFIIARVGTFSASGEISTFQNSWQKVCKEKARSSAWLAHKLKRGTTLTTDSGKKLALNINQTLKNTCFDRVEIDLEPIFKVELWHVDFFASVRKHLDSHFKLDVTIEPPSERLLPNEVLWKKRDVQRILDVVDGIDVMNYDTGYKKYQDYSDLVSTSAEILIDILAIQPGKQIRFGLPAYQDATKLHNADIENIRFALQGLKQVKDLKRLCNRNFQFAYFEAGDMHPQDIEWSHQLEDWHRSACRKF